MSQKDRIALKIDPEYLVILKRLGELQNKPVTSLVQEFLNQLRPVVELQIEALEELALGKKQEDIVKKYFIESLRVVNNEIDKP